MRKTLGIAALGAALAVAASAPAQATFNPVENPSDFKLYKTGFDRDAVNDLAFAWGRKVFLNEVIENATQRTRALADSDKDTRKVPRDAVAGFRWDSDDENKAYWLPQGITAPDTEVEGGYRVLLVSWHSDSEYARITLVEAGGQLQNARYRHIILVYPKAGGGAGLVKTHAGGIAWYRHWLYVAKKDVGLLVFDLRDITLVDKERRDDVLGYDYMLPRTGYYEKRNNPGMIFSSVSIDRSTPTPALVTSEFRGDDDDGTGRIMRWKINTETGLLGEVAEADGAWRLDGHNNIQGSMTKDGKIAVTTSWSTETGFVYSGRPNGSVFGVSWPDYVEGLHYEEYRDRVYSLTEHEGSRRVFAVKAPDLLL
jgi:hypothetical protein